MRICYPMLLIVILIVVAAENASSSALETRTGLLKEETFRENITQENATFPLEFPNIRIPLEDMAEFIVEAKDNFLSGCVFIVHADVATQGVLAYRIFARFQQLLSSLSVHSAVVSFSSLLQNPTEICCCKNTSLMITLYESTALKHYFQELWKNQTRISSIWITFLQLEDWEEFLAAVNVPFYIQFLIAQPKAGSGILLTELYRVAPGMPLTSSFYGEWERCGQNIWPTTAMYRRRSDLQGLKLTATGVNSSMTMVFEDSKDGDMKITSFAGNLWHEIQQMTNFKIEVKLPADGNYGSVDSNGNWNGIINVLINGEAEISVTSLDMSLKRAAVVDFLSPVTFARYNIVIKKKLWYVPTWNSLLKPFKAYLWLTVLITVIANAIALTFISKMGHFHFNEKYFGPSDSLLYVLAALAQQCGSFPRFTSARVVCICSHLMALVLLASYSASLVSFLTVRREQLPFHDWKSMIEVGTYKLVLVYSSFEYDLITTNSTGVYNDVFTQLMGSSTNDSSESYLDALKRVCSVKNVALLSNEISIRMVLPEVECDLTVIPIDLNHTSAAFLVRKNSPYRDVFNTCFQVFRERGIYQRLWLRFARTLQLSDEDKEQRFIEFTDVLPLLAILGFGCFLALLLLGLEVMSAYILKRRSKCFS